MPSSTVRPVTRARRRTRRSRRPAAVILAVVILLGAVAVGWAGWRDAFGDPHLSPLRARIVAVAQGELGYQTDPPHSYCNKYSAFWGQGGTDCGPGLRSEEWCADFAAWVWQQAGALVDYSFTGGLNSGSVSFYQWGLAHGTWHPIGSGYTPQPGDVAVYGLDTATMVASHVAVVTSYTAGQRGPDVVNGDGDQTGYSVVEAGTDQYQADARTKGEPLSGYVAPSRR